MSKALQEYIDQRAMSKRMGLVPFGLADIRKLYDQGRREQNSRQSYTVDRVAELPSARYEQSSYTTDLPRFEGKNVIEILTDLTSKNQKSAVLDVGCGKGNFLIEMHTRFAQKLTCHGITSFPYHDEQHALAEGIVIDVLDVQSMFRRQTYDLIVAEHSLQYVQNPLLALKRIYDALKPNGIALINPFVMSFRSPEEEEQFIGFMTDNYGFDFRKIDFAWKVAFKKNQTKRLTLPVGITRIADVEAKFGLPTNLRQTQYTFIAT